VYDRRRVHRSRPASRGGFLPRTVMPARSRRSEIRALKSLKTRFPPKKAQKFSPAAHLLFTPQPQFQHELAGPDGGASPLRCHTCLASFAPEPLTIVHFIQYRPSTAPPRAAEWLASSHTKGLLQPRPREAGAAPRTAGQLEEEQRACGTRERQSHWWDLQGGPVRTSRGRRGHRERV